MRGFCGIGVERSKTEVNVGTLWRSADLLDASFVFTIGRRYKRQASDTMKSWRRIPLWHFDTIDQLLECAPYDSRIIGIEIDERAKPLQTFDHPERCVYLLGAEDHGLDGVMRNRCHALVQLPGRASMNVAAAGTVVLYDRLVKGGAP